VLLVQLVMVVIGNVDAGVVGVDGVVVVWFSCCSCWCCDSLDVVAGVVGVGGVVVVWFSCCSCWCCGSLDGVAGAICWCFGGGFVVDDVTTIRYIASFSGWSVFHTIIILCRQNRVVLPDVGKDR